MRFLDPIPDLIYELCSLVNRSFITQCVFNSPTDGTLTYSYTTKCVLHLLSTVIVTAVELTDISGSSNSIRHFTSLGLVVSIAPGKWREGCQEPTETSKNQSELIILVTWLIVVISQSGTSISSSWRFMGFLYESLYIVASILDVRNIFLNWLRIRNLFLSQLWLVHATTEGNID